MRQLLKSTIAAAALAVLSLVATQASAQASCWAEYKTHAANRIVEYNQGMTFDGEVPAILASIPVLEVNLEEDGSVAQINVVREPQNAPETMQMAMDAIMRAAPFGDVSHLPKPWVFTETFLYDEGLRFQLRSRQE
jgi:hypothetical protein